MAVDVKVPAVGESIQEAMIHKWHKKSGDFVEMDEVILELETDKATVEVVAEAEGTLEVLAKDGETVGIGDTIARIDTSGARTSQGSSGQGSSGQGSSGQGSSDDSKTEPAKGGGKEGQATPDRPAGQETGSDEAVSTQSGASRGVKSEGRQSTMADTLSPAVRRLVEENKLNPEDLQGTGPGGRLTKEDVQSYLNEPTKAKASPSKTKDAAASHSQQNATSGERLERREPMSMLRRRIAERLVSAQQTAALLTTFNEVDLTNVIAVRKQYKEPFKEKHGVGLGFMSFFVKATIEALKSFPAINGWIEGNEVVYHDYYDIGVAVSSKRGLVVPVVRDVDKMSFAEVEQSIMDYALKARDGKISIDDMTGGTFTVSNGGVFGSLLSTPIINPPQSAILGMHKIQERPMAVDGQVVIRPMMYLALSYDHRIVDGKEAVQFLVKIKDSVEDPHRLLLGV